MRAIMYLNASEIHSRLRFRQTSSVSEAGLTLVEVLIALAVTSIIMTAIYAVFETQVRGQVAQEVALEMQQGARAATELMSLEIRSAGCDPSSSAGAGILIAESARIRFTADIVDAAGNAPHDNELTGPNEDITYRLTNDADLDGIADGTPCHLGRDTGDGNGLQAICENVDALNLVYLDNDGNLLASPVADPAQIRRIEIAFVARSGEIMPGLIRRYVDNNDYSNLQGDVILPAPGDNFHRLQQTATYYLRNN